jgi:hypothetical protein
LPLPFFILSIPIISALPFLYFPLS